MEKISDSLLPSQKLKGKREKREYGTKRVTAFVIFYFLLFLLGG